MITEEFPGVRLQDVIAALKKRGRDDEAEYWRLTVAIELGMLHDIPEDDVLDMPMDRIITLMKLPPRPEGWDNWFYGRAAIGDNQG